MRACNNLPQPPPYILFFGGVAEDCCMLSILLAVPSCIYSFWHGVIPTSYFIFNDFYTCIIWHNSSFFIVQSDYQLALNTTVYYSNILSNTPLNTPVYRIRAIINAQSMEILVLQFRTGQNNESDLFEFECGINERITKSDCELVSIGSKRV